MPRTFSERLEAIDRTALTPPVRCALDSQTVEIIEWKCQQIHGGVGDYDSDAPGVGGIARFTGTGLDQGKQYAWSLIFKVLPMLRPSPDSHRGIRELHAYQSGFLDTLPGDVTAPRFLGSLEEPGEAACLWLEDMVDDVDKPWPLSHFGLVARHFGQLSGVYLVGQALPEEPWLSRKWLRWSVGRRASDMADLARLLDHPLIRRRFPGDTADRTFRLWVERETLLAVIEGLPQTFCHLDVFPRNIFATHSADGHARSTAVDWAFSGIAALGEEITPLIWGSVAFNEVDPAKLPELEALVFESYLDGMRDAGWRGSPEDMRIGYTLSACLRFGFPRAVSFLTDENNSAQVKLVFGVDIGDFIDLLGNLQRTLLGLADEGCELLKSRR